MEMKANTTMKTNTKTNTKMKTNTKQKTMTCEYFIQRTNKPRICGKKSYIVLGENDDKNDTDTGYISLYNDTTGFLSLVFPVHFKCSGPSLQLCRTHSTLLEKQTKIKAARTPGISEKVIATSLLHFHLEFQQKISVDDAKHDEPEVRFIEIKTEDEILASKFEEAKNDGRYIDLTEDESKKYCPICIENFLPQNVIFLDCSHTVCKKCFFHIKKTSWKPALFVDQPSMPFEKIKTKK